jgi:hypothetical protein
MVRAVSEDRLARIPTLSAPLVERRRASQRASEKRDSARVKSLPKAVKGRPKKERATIAILKGLRSTTARPSTGDP